MKPFLNILVGLNEGASSRHALATAVALAEREGAKVTACRVLPIGDLGEYVDFYQVEHQEMIDEARQSLVNFVNEVAPPDHEVSCRISEGSPHHELVSIADEGNYDLLILGSGDETEKTRDSGQFAIRCLRFATLPVLIVNQGPVAPPSPPLAACLDFSDSTTPILEHLARIAPAHCPDLHLIHACRPPWLQATLPFLRRKPDGDDHSGEKRRFRELIDGRLAMARDQAAARLDAPVIESIRLEHRDPDRALLDHLASNDYRLIVLGRSGKGLKGLVTDVLGGTAEGLIRHARCPVFVVPLSS